MRLTATGCMSLEPIEYRGELVALVGADRFHLISPRLLACPAEDAEAAVRDVHVCVPPSCRGGRVDGPPGRRCPREMGTARAHRRARAAGKPATCLVQNSPAGCTCLSPRSSHGCGARRDRARQAAAARPRGAQPPAPRSRLRARSRRALLRRAERLGLGPRQRRRVLSRLPHRRRLVADRTLSHRADVPATTRRS